MNKIRSFADKETRNIYEQCVSLKIPIQVQRIALRKLILIDNAGTLLDLAIPPANHLEQLKGDRAGQYSIRINAKYRICFRHENGYFYDLEICDYH